MSGGDKSSFEKVLPIAQMIAREITPYCERVHVAGSLRRRKQEVGDIEIVAVAKWGERKAAPPDEGLFASAEGPTESHSLLLDWARSQSLLDWIKPGTKKGTPLVFGYTPEADGKYWRGVYRDPSLPEVPDSNGVRGIKVDLFLPGLDNFGTIYLIRTGSQGFSNAVMAYTKNFTGYRFHNGLLWTKDQYEIETAPKGKGKGTPLVTREEEEVFRLVGMRCPRPPDRSIPDGVNEHQYVKRFVIK